MANLDVAIIELDTVPRLDVEIRRGSDHQIRFRVKVNSVVQDPAGWVITAELRAFSGDLLAAYACDLYTDAASVVWIRCRIPAADTANLQPAASTLNASKKGAIGRYDVKVRDASGAVAFVRWGHATLANWDTVA